MTHFRSLSFSLARRSILGFYDVSATVLYDIRSPVAILVSLLCSTGFLIVRRPSSGLTFTYPQPIPLHARYRKSYLLDHVLSICSWKV